MDVFLARLQTKDLTLTASLYKPHHLLIIFVSKGFIFSHEQDLLLVSVINSPNSRRFHYRGTCMIIVAFSIMVTATEWIAGEL